jgi:hypothetical protein
MDIGAGVIEPGACLSDDEAHDFVCGTLARSRFHAVEAHLDGCVHCLGFVAALADAVSSQPSTYRSTPAAARQSARDFIAALELGQFRGTERFEVVRRVGSGGMGVVYEAYDRDQGTRIALKVLPTRSPEALLQFKNEFRSLQDLQHPNLVRMGELFVHDGQWFFTMELVDGIDFLRYVWDVPLSRIDGPSAPSLGIPYDVSRLRSALRQLALGLSVLHDSGKVHRDIKPKNTLITNADRLVILDFGLVHTLGPQESTELHTVGTVAYMAPEQAARVAAGPPADWYSTGVMLFEALTGRLPFSGSPPQILADKQSRPPPSVESLNPTVPSDLAALCNQLLRLRPEERPDGRGVLACLEGERVMPRDERAGALKPVPFVGRHEELARLRAALETARAGRAALVLIEGESGIGKSALVRQFTDEVRGVSPETVILKGRCYERESVAYKAFDGVLDELSRLLLRLPAEEVVRLLPASTSAPLAKAFPVLGRVRALAAATSDETVLDRQQLRSQLFAALRELFIRLGARHPLILAIDDLQWSDVDSLALLAELMRDPDPPALLLVATLRSGDSGAPAVARELGKTLQRLGDKVSRLSVERLPHRDARVLAAALLEHNWSPPSLDPEQVAEEARGHPLYIDELVRHQKSMAAGYETGPGVAVAHLDEALWSRACLLDHSAGQLLATVAVAGAPLAQKVSERASNLAPDAFHRALAQLRVEHLARTTGTERNDLVECYHDRVREAVVAHLDAPCRREIHRSLAIALSGTDDDELLSVHWHAAGESEKAAHHAIAAAERAAQALAFERAARLYRFALELQRTDGPDDYVLRVKLGEMLANAGRGRESAGAYLSAVAKAGAAETRLELRQHAAEQLLRCGHIDAALDLYRTIQRAVGIPLAETPARALLSLLWQRVRIRTRGLGFVERDQRQVARRDLQRIDTGFAVGLGLSTVNTVRGAELLARTLRFALDAGEPYRVARALALEAAVNASGQAARGQARTRALVEAASAIATRIDHPHALGLAAWAAGASAYLEGRWKSGAQLADQALAIYRSRCTGVGWETASAQAFSLWSRYYLGELAEIARRMPELIKEARVRGDLYDTTNLRTSHTNIWWLAADDPERAADEVHEAMREWSPKGFHLPHYYELHALSQCDLYCGRGRAALARVGERWSPMKRAFLFEVVAVKLEMFFLRARAALAAAMDGGVDQPALLAVAAADARRLAAARMAWSTALAQLVRAGVAAVAGQTETARAGYCAAAEGLLAADMRLFAACADRRRGQLAHPQDARLVEQAEAWMRAQGIVNPARMCATLVPGVTD